MQLFLPKSSPINKSLHIKKGVVLVDVIFSNCVMVVIEEADPHNKCTVYKISYVYMPNYACCHIPIICG